ncbi:unnamed protein product [Cylindrotheca closterium]|uniref:Palmitoyltransferase n=1 Tax=Cylindrotheca closterium TaxID=2856 RepID=A0AAD2PWH0_9STRA|nr:unnamed protein product [Cylindrotheca closterium]
MKIPINTLPLCLFILKGPLATCAFSVNPSSLQESPPIHHPRTTRRRRTNKKKDHDSVVISPLFYRLRDQYDTNTGIGPLHGLAGPGKLAGTQALIQALLQEHHDESSSSLLELLDNTRDPKMGTTPFHWAVCGMTTSLQGGGGSIQVCQWMIDRVFEEGGKDSVVKLCNLPCRTHHSTPLMYAAWGGNVRLCELLLDEGEADPMYADKRGQNALHWAAAAGHLKVCQYLAGKRYHQYFSSASALLLEEAEDDGAVQEQEGADSSSAKHMEHGPILETDNSGLTSLDYAIQYNRDDIIEWMMKVL